MRKRILVLDDDHDILEIISFILTDSGYEVETLSSGEQIFSVISQFHPDLVLMDVMLADLDGRVICKNLKQNQHTDHIPVILISGTDNLANSLKQHGAPNDFVPKSFDLNILIDKIKAQLE